MPNLLPRESVVLLPLVIGQSLRMKTGVKTRKVIVSRKPLLVSFPFRFSLLKVWMRSDSFSFLLVEGMDAK